MLGLQYDNPAAADIVTTMLDLDTTDTTSCMVLKSVDMCMEDPVVQRVCAATCTTDRRRLEDMTPRQQQQRLAARHKYGLKFKLALEAIEDELEKQGRRLGMEVGGNRVEIYGTWDPTNRPDWCAAATGQEELAKLAPPSESLLNAQLYDFYGFDKKVPGHFAISKTCPMQRKYETTSRTYCQGNNMVINGNQLVPQSIQDKLCWSQCL